MDRKFTLELIQVGTQGKNALYSIRFEDEPLNEFDKFLENEALQQEPEFDEMIEELFRLLDKRSFSSHYFKQKKYPSPTCAYYFKGKLRLYGCLYGSTIFIAGNGGIKRTRTIQENPLLHTFFDDMKMVAQHIDREIIQQKSMLVSDRGFLEPQSRKLIERQSFNVNDDE